MSEQTNKVIEKIKEKRRYTLDTEDLDEVAWDKGYNQALFDMESFLSQELESLEEKVKQETIDQALKIIQEAKKKYLMPYEEDEPADYITEQINKLSSHPLQDKEKVTDSRPLECDGLCKCHEEKLPRGLTVAVSCIHCQKDK